MLPRFLSTYVGEELWRGRQVGSYFGNRISFGLPTGVYCVIPEDKSLKSLRVVKMK